MKLGVLISGLFGLGLAVWLLDSFGVQRILDLLAQAGWGGVGAVIAFHFIQIAFSAASWREIAGPMPRRPSLWAYYVLRWIREAVNNLLPVAQIGGEFVSARLLQQRGVALAPAIAGTVADLTMEMLSQIPFTILGLGLLLHSVGAGDLSRYVVSAVLVALSVSAGFLAAQWFGLALAFERMLMWLGTKLGWAGTGQVQGLHEALRECYRRPRRVLLALTWQSVSWLLGGLEVMLALHLLGHDVSLSEGTIIEALGQVLKAAGFAVPGALGVQEGGYIVICQALALPPEVAIALSLLKRLREVVLGIPGLIAWRVMSRGLRMDEMPEASI